MTTRELNWRVDAECQYVGTELFYPGEGQSSREAQRVCAVCPVRQECLDDALNEEWGNDRTRRYGVRGGLTPHARYYLERQMKESTEAA